MNIRSIDVRGMEPPEPLETILNNLESLAADEKLEVTHWREPLLLYPILDEQGWQKTVSYNKNTQIYLITIWKPAI